VEPEPFLQLLLVGAALAGVFMIQAARQSRRINRSSAFALNRKGSAWRAQPRGPHDVRRY